MPTVLTETFEQPAPLNPPRKRWTRAQCEALEASGVWAQERLELVNGELISKMGKKVPHFFSMHALRGMLDDVFGRTRVYTEIPIDVAPPDLPTNEPEPDLIVLKNEIRQFTSNPAPADVALLVEVSDSTLRFDLSVKAGLYARAEIEEYWVLDVNNRRLIVHRQPQNGTYAEISVFAEGESAASLAAPDRLLRVAGMLPPSGC